jgi:hypothetical protein
MESKEFDKIYVLEVLNGVDIGASENEVPGAPPRTGGVFEPNQATKSFAMPEPAGVFVRHRHMVYGSGRI